MVYSIRTVDLGIDFKKHFGDEKKYYPVRLGYKEIVEEHG
jgi:hypothetical protein